MADKEENPSESAVFDAFDKMISADDGKGEELEDIGSAGDTEIEGTDDLNLDDLNNLNLDDLNLDSLDLSDVDTGGEEKPDTPQDDSGEVPADIGSEDLSGVNATEISGDDNSGEIGADIFGAVGEEPEADEIGADSGEIGDEAEAGEPVSEIGGTGDDSGEIGVDDSGEIGVDDSGEIGPDDTGDIEAEPADDISSIFGAPEVSEPDEEEAPSEEKEEKPKKKKKEKVKKAAAKGNAKGGGLKGLFHKLFDNIPYTDEELAAIPTPEQEAEAAKEKAEAAAAAKEAAAAAKDQKKKDAEEAKKAKAQAAREAKAEKERQKKEAAEKRVKLEEADTEPEGHINKAGAGVVFVFFILIAAGVILGSNQFSYDFSIKAATSDFQNKEYNDAYDEIAGLSVKDKDMLIHDKIYTVQYVNTQLNSFNNFYAMGDYARALDSLIKGLKRYDKYLALAEELGVSSDLDYVKKQMLGKLQEIYGLSEKDARELIEIQDTQEYSETIYAMVNTLDIKQPPKKQPTEYVN